MFFFWVTLLSSLSLFVFVITFYLKFFSFDFNLVTSVFTFLLTTSSLKSLFTTSFSWLVLLIAISIKCGLVPFYLWKPSFFKGMTLSALFFYVYVYYFTIFFFFSCARLPSRRWKLNNQIGKWHTSENGIRPLLNYFLNYLFKDKEK